MNAITAYSTCYMGGDKPWFVTTPKGNLVRRQGKGFAQFETKDEAESFAKRLDAGKVRLDENGRVPAVAIT